MGKISSLRGIMNTLNEISSQSPKSDLGITLKSLDSAMDIAYAFKSSLISMSYLIALNGKNPEEEKVLVEKEHLTEGFCLLVKELYDKLPEVYKQT